MFLEQFAAGQVFTTRSHTMALADIRRFAAEFDPEYMHLDPDKARAGRYGGIIASGMHTLAVTFKLWVELGLYGDEVIAGKEMTYERFLKPVYPDDLLHVVVRVAGIQATKHDRGLLTVQLATYNQLDEQVLEAEITALVKRATGN